MFYMHGGKIYAPRNKNGKLVYDLMAVREGAGNSPYIVKAGGSAKTLPPGAFPMTESELIAHAPIETILPEGGAVDTDVSGI